MFKIAVALCILAVANAQISNEYLPPVEQHFEAAPVQQHFSAPAPVQQHFSEPSSEYLPPVSNHVDVEPAHSFSQDDGYRYKTARRRVYRNRVVRRRY